MNNPIVSIIIPTYNRSHLIHETLDSVLEQTYTSWECIVVDDGSMDNTEEILISYTSKDARFQYHKRPLNKKKGANACRNYGFEMSKGEFVNWFDDDDLMHPDKLLIQIKALENNDFNFTVCQTLVFENSIENIIGLRSKNIYSKDVFYDYLIQKIAWLTQSPIWKRAFLNKLEYLFDEDLQAAQEWEFHCRVLAFSKDYKFINEPLVYIRQHKNSITYKEGDRQKRTWNYFLARSKIYKNTKIIRNKYVDNYLQDYLLAVTKKFLISKQFKLSLKALFIYLLPDKKITLLVKVYAVIFMFSYYFFNKGYCLFKKINYSRK